MASPSHFRRSTVWIDIAVSDELSARIGEDLPLSTLRQRLDRAINAALDAEGWPRGDRGMIDIPTSHWFVNLRHKKSGLFKGHVGPISDKDKALRTAESWEKVGFVARLDRVPRGSALTNAS